VSVPALWGRDTFMAELLKRFPLLAPMQDRHVTGLLHCEMGWFSHATGDAIDIREFRLVRAHFEFIDEALSCGSDALENAILVSYLENVFGRSTPDTARARDLLTPELLRPVIEMEGHFIERVAGTLPAIPRQCGTAAAEELGQRLSAMMAAETDAAGNDANG
jgi:hypothetical protein